MRQEIVTDNGRPNLTTKPLARCRRVTTCTMLAIAGLIIPVTPLARALTTANLVTNGNFNAPLTNGSTTSTVWGPTCQIGGPSPTPATAIGAACPFAQIVPGWVGTGINVLFFPGTADTTGASWQSAAPAGTRNCLFGGMGSTGPGCSFKMNGGGPGGIDAGPSPLGIWGPGINTAINCSVTTAGCANGPANGLSGPPKGGNFIAMDGDWLETFGVAGQGPGTATTPGVAQGRLTQMITGLHPGTAYNITFDWAGAHQAAYGLPAGVNSLSEQLLVGLCSGSQLPGPFNAFGPATGGANGTCGFYTNEIQVPDRGFVPWKQFTATIDATAPDETLSFLALGMPTGAPPLILLDDISLSPVPEPGTLGLLGTGLIALAGMAKRKLKI